MLPLSHFILALAGQRRFGKHYFQLVDKLGVKTLLTGFFPSEFFIMLIFEYARFKLTSSPFDGTWMATGIIRFNCNKWANKKIDYSGYNIKSRSNCLYYKIGLTLLLFLFFLYVNNVLNEVDMNHIAEFLKVLTFLKHKISGSNFLFFTKCVASRVRRRYLVILKLPFSAATAAFLAP